MNLLIVGLLGLMLAQPLQAKEIKQGTLEVTGGSSYYNQKAESSNNTNSVTTTDKETNLQITGAIYIQKNIAIGLDVFSSRGITSYSNNTPDDKYSLTMISPIVAYNISVSSHSSIELLIGKAGAIKGEKTYQFGNNPQSSSTVSGQFYSVTFKNYLNNYVSINLGLSKTKTKYSSDQNSGESNDNITGIDLGLSVLF